MDALTLDDLRRTGEAAALAARCEAAYQQAVEACAVTLRAGAPCAAVADEFACRLVIETLTQSARAVPPLLRARLVAEGLESLDGALAECRLLTGVDRAVALAALTPSADEGLYEEVLYAIAEQPFGYDRLWGFAEVLDLVPAERRPDVARRALQAAEQCATTSDLIDEAPLLRRALPALPDDSVDAAIALARSCPHEFDRVALLGTLAARRPELAGEVLELAEHAMLPGHRIGATAIAPYVDGRELPRLVALAERWSEAGDAELAEAVLLRADVAPHDRERLAGGRPETGGPARRLQRFLLAYGAGDAGALIEGLLRDEDPAQITAGLPTELHERLLELCEHHDASELIRPLVGVIEPRLLPRVTALFRRLGPGAELDGDPPAAASSDSLAEPSLALLDGDVEALVARLGTGALDEFLEQAEWLLGALTPDDRDALLPYLCERAPELDHEPVEKLIALARWSPEAWDLALPHVRADGHPADALALAAAASPDRRAAAHDLWLAYLEKGLAARPEYPGDAPQNLLSVLHLLGGAEAVDAARRWYAAVRERWP